MAQHVTATQNTCGPNYSAYSPDDLGYLQAIVDELLTGLIESGDYAVRGDGKENLKRALTRALFAIARPGERDAVSLKRRTMRSLLPPIR
jgi:hypothetical protein